jgi:histone deacetylase 1/2
MTCYQDVVGHPEWKLAMAEGIVALERTDTWDLIPLLPAFIPSHVSGSIYNIKIHPEGYVERYKVRLVARGVQQDHGCNYDESFAPCGPYDHYSYISSYCICSPPVHISA